MSVGPELGSLFGLLNIDLCSSPWGLGTMALSMEHGGLPRSGYHQERSQIHEREGMGTFLH